MAKARCMRMSSNVQRVVGGWEHEHAVGQKMTVVKLAMGMCGVFGGIPFLQTGKDSADQESGAVERSVTTTALHHGFDEKEGFDAEMAEACDQMKAWIDDGGRGLRDP